MVLTYRNDVGCMWLNAITKQSLSVVELNNLELRY